jgi:hypothetical protein
MALTACGSAAASSPSDAGTDADASTRDSEYPPGYDASPMGTVITCSGPLQDAGFSSLADLPLAQLCAQSATASDSPGGLVLQSPAPCAGLIWVSSATGIDCSEFWLFDATTGALQASGNTCNASYYACLGSVPGFTFPNQCIVPNHGWIGNGKEQCPDAGG